ncbi:MAG: replicative helicase loader/inhibitor [Defluviitaleaceae bacterium]|nr:replicative helicase loader/inhibitor [Defluviitaleaceae bacterium]
MPPAEITALSVPQQAFYGEIIDPQKIRQIYQYEALVTVELLKLRYAFPVQSQSASVETATNTAMVWAEALMGIEPEIIHAAVAKFIKDDRKGFFPSPGQIVGLAEKIIIERKNHDLHLANMQQMLGNFDPGEECCGTCENSHPELEQSKYHSGIQIKYLYCAYGNPKVPAYFRRKCDNYRNKED